MCGTTGYTGTWETGRSAFNYTARYDHYCDNQANSSKTFENKFVSKQCFNKIASLPTQPNKKRNPDTLRIVHILWAMLVRTSKYDPHPHSVCNGSLAIVRKNLFESHMALLPP